MTKTVNEDNPKSSLSIEDYSRMLTGMNLVSVYLEKCEGKVDHHATGSAFEASRASGGVPIDVKESASYTADGEIVSIRHSYALDAKFKRKPLLRLKAEYVLTFQATTGFDDEFFSMFKEASLPLFTWPYFREYVGSMTGRMELPTLYLGVKFAPKF